MRIFELKTIDRKTLYKLKNVADMEISDFIKMIETKQDKKEHINKPYLDLYISIIQNKPLIQAAEKAMPTIQPIFNTTLNELRLIPINELNYYFKDNKNIICRLQAGILRTLADLFETDSAELMKYPNIGPAFITRILVMKDFVVNNADRIIQQWKHSTTIFELPTNYDRNRGLCQNAKEAIWEYAQIIEYNQNDNRYFSTPQQKKSFLFLASIFKKYYGEGKNDTQIAQETGYSSERIRQIRSKAVTRMLNGEIFFNNYKLNSGLLDLISSLKEQCMYDVLSKYITYVNSSDTSFLTDIGCDWINIKNTSFLIPRDTKGIYKTVGNVIIQVLLDNPLPTDKDVLFDLILKNEELSSLDFDDVFVQNVLSCDEIVDLKDNNLIQLKKEYLTSAGQRYARIIYESSSKLTTKQVKDIYTDIYKVNPTNGPGAATIYGISCEGKRLWYYGQPKESLQKIVSDFAESKREFYYSEIERHVIQLGFTIPPAFRVYITNICASDVKDKDHFCHKEYVDDYSDTKWRSPMKYGWANWIFNEIRSILCQKDEIEEKNLIKELDQRSKSTGYKDIILRLPYMLSKYCGEDKPFIIQDGNVKINRIVFDKTDFETIGLRSSLYPYYKQIRSIAANEVKKATKGQISLMNFISIINNTFSETISRNTIIRAIEDEQHRFEPIDVVLIKDSGNLYLQWTKKDTNAEPVYYITSSKEDTEKEEVSISEGAAVRVNIAYRQTINWADLCDAMKKELRFYNVWMKYYGFNLDNSVDKFVKFLTNAQNQNLKRQIPLDLYEYWFAKTDAYDRNRYVNDLLICFEAVLREIYYIKEGEKVPQTKGLIDTTRLFSGLSEMFLSSRDSKGFDRIASDLGRKRNIVAHGDSLNLNSGDTALLINNLVAFYVFVVAKYI